MSETLIELITRHEGKRRTVYDDETGEPLKAGMTLIGHPTIGVGINLEEPLSDAAIQQMLRDKLNDSINECLHAFPWYAELTERRQWAVLSLHFNLGLPRLLGFKKFRQAMALGDYETAANELVDSDAGRKLKTRYTELANMIRGSVAV